MNKEKIKTYIGFAIKSNAVCYGIDNLKKNIKLVLYNETISNNSIDKIKKFCEINKTNVYAEDALNQILDEFLIEPLDLKGLLCMEVDTKEDLKKVKEILK